MEEPPGIPEAWHEGKGENDPARMQLALRFNLSEAIANGMLLTANANGMTCLLARCEAMTFASPQSPDCELFFKAIECAAVIYGGHEQRR